MGGSSIVTLTNSNVKMRTVEWTNEEISAFPGMELPAAAAVGSVIYSFGGYVFSVTAQYEEIYDRPIDVYKLDTSLILLEWQVLSEVKVTRCTPIRKDHHTAVAFGHHIYLLGGYDERTDGNILYRFNTKSNAWDRPPVSGKIPGARRNHAAVVLRKHMYVFGGQVTREPSARGIYALNFETMVWTWIPTHGPTPTHRHHHTATVYDDRFIFIYGGMEIKKNVQTVKFNHLECFDAETMTWTVPKLSTAIRPQIRNSHCAFVHNGCLYVFGGCSGVTQTYVNDLFRFDPEASEWKEVEPIQPQQGPPVGENWACVVVGDRVFIFGGWGPAVYFKDTFVLETASVA